MISRLTRVVAASTAVMLLGSGCMISRAVDRAFIGITVLHPTYDEHKTTGIVLLPLSFAVDVVTFPIQALLVVILGDNFPFNDANTSVNAITLRDDARFKQLGAEQQQVALRELEALRQAGRLTKNSALGLDENGHWTVVELTADAREQLLARAQSPRTADALVCAR